MSLRSDWKNSMITFCMYYWEENVQGLYNVHCTTSIYSMSCSVWSWSKCGKKHIIMKNSRVLQIILYSHKFCITYQSINQFCVFSAIDLTVIHLFVLLLSLGVTKLHSLSLYCNYGVMLNVEPVKGTVSKGFFDSFFGQNLPSEPL